MAGILTFEQYVGGPDEVILEQAFPSTQRSVIYNFNTDITGYQFTAEHKPIIVDKIKFNRYTGAPNFSDSKVIGFFPNTVIQENSDNAPTIINNEQGTVLVTFPEFMYSGPIIPDARQNVPIVIFALTWKIPSTVDQIQTHRWGFIQAWEPGVTIEDPANDQDFTGLN